MYPEAKGSPEKLTGQQVLQGDVLTLLKEIEEFQFDDFKNTKYAAPKVELRNQLLALAENVVQGKYD